VLQVSRRVEYALRAVICLAREQRSEPLSFKAIAEIESIPPDYLAKILRTLGAAGIVNATRGASGGYELAIAPEQLSFLDVIEAAEGRIALNLCTDSGEGCAHNANCTMALVWRAGERAMTDVFRRTRISDLVCAPLNLVRLEADFAVPTSVGS
jgi:Rrf2 family protein